MKVAIISDIHDNLVNLEKCLVWCGKNGIEEIICCGDVTNSETIGILAGGFKGDIYLVKGNVELYDAGELRKYKNIKYYERVGRVQLDKKWVGFCHEPYLVDYVLKKGACDIIFHGHTHRPWMEEREEVVVVNPGTLGGMLARATFAVWESGGLKPELIILDEV